MSSSTLPGCIALGLALAGCNSVSQMGMGSRLVLFSAMAPVGGLVAAHALVTQTYSATPAQRQSALRIAQRAEARLRPAVRQELISRGSPYISVRTPAASGRPSVMVYDIERDQLATDKVFEVEQEPKKNSYVEFDNYFSHYVGGKGGEEAPKAPEPEKKNEPKP